MHKENIGKSQETLIFSLRVGNALIGIKRWQQGDTCITLKQVHSNLAIRLEDFPAYPVEGDAIVTSKRGIKIGVKTADCVPIILVGKKDIAAVHAGWRGLKDGVIENTLKLMQDDPKDIFAFLGPSAKSCCYQVGESFKDFFRAITYRNGSIYMDTQKEALLKLKSLGISRFFLWSTCTICNISLPSYRREKTKERLLTFVERD